MTSQSVFSDSRRPGQQVWLRRFIAGLLLAALPLWGILAGLIQPASAGPVQRPHQILATNVVISEFRTTGGSGNADDEFIEIFNPTNGIISLNGWTIKRATGCGTPVATAMVTFGSTDELNPGQHLLIVNSGASAALLALQNKTYSSSIADNGGIAILNNIGAVIDAVGMCAGITYVEGIFLNYSPSTNTTQSYERKPEVGVNGCYDTNNNANDFVFNAIYNPQNLASTTTLCPAPTPTNTATQTLTPTATQDWPLKVVINEVAWGGTQADTSSAQWIELYNPRGTDVNITGWHLITNSVDTVLSGTILAGDYFLLGSANNGNPIFQGLPVNQTFSGSLSLFGDTLRLYASSGELVDTANLNDGPWPAGTSFLPYASMERNGVNPDNDAIWFTFMGIPTVNDRLGNPINGSPGQPNSANGVTQTPTPTPTTTVTSTITPTSTVTSTATITPTRTLTPTVTITSTRTNTPTRTITLTRTLTPTKTLTPLNSPTRTQTATATAILSMELVINEVAWMGTSSTNSSDEWIELYNPGSANVNLTGWKLKAADGTPDIDLVGSIPAGEYFLLESSSDLVVSNYLADQIYPTGVLANSAETLQLFSPDGELVDIANGNGSYWPAGNASTYCSMERIGPNVVDSDGTWITSTGVTKNGDDRAGNKICGSPKFRNWAYDVTPTPSKTPTKTGTPPTATRSVTPRKTITRTPTPNPATPEPIILNEFLAQPRSDWNGDGKVDSGDGFIELRNLSSQSISISGYKLDDKDGDSLPYTIQDVTMQPKTRKVFFASETGILLSTGGDSVRLYKSGSLPSDAFTYSVIKVPDQTWCRLPDNSDPFSYEKMTWKFGCEPTIGLPNKLAESVFVANRVEAAICLSKNLPWGVYLAECDPLGLEMWSQSLWDALPPDYPRFFDVDNQEFILE